MRRTRKDPDSIVFNLPEELLLSRLKLDGFRKEVLVCLFLVEMLKSFLLML